MAFVIILLILLGVPVLMTMPREIRWIIVVVVMLTAFPVGIIVLIEAIVAEIALSGQ